jgi:hypothetical protein
MSIEGNLEGKQLLGRRFLRRCVNKMLAPCGRVNSVTFLEGVVHSEVACRKNKHGLESW